MNYFNKWTVSFPLPNPIGTVLKRNSQSFGTGLLSHSAKTFATTMKLPPIQAEEFLGLHFNLGNKLGYTINGIAGEIKTCQYNFIYVPPHTGCEISVQKGAYESLGIQFPAEYLKILKELFPILDIMLKKIKHKELFAISSNHINCNAEMLQEINYLLENKPAEQGTDATASTVASELIRLKLSSFLIACLFDLSAKANHSVSNDAIRHKIETARSYLLDHLREPLSVDRLSKKVDLEEHKLRKYFKVMYKCTMLDFVRDARLEKAKALLIETELPIEKIGLATGNKNFPHFSNSFKKKYGYSPREFRDKLGSGNKETETQ